MSVQVVIVNWNAGPLLAACIGSIRLPADDVSKVVVVDNGSTDGSDRLASFAMPVEVIRTGRNLGFAAACNLGAAQSKAEFLLFLNPDTKLEPGTLAGVLAHMSMPAARDVGVCGIRLYGDDTVPQPHTTALPTWRTIFNVDLFRTRFDHRSSRRVGHVIGAFYLIRRSVFEAVGGFDERFFVYLEDLDLSLRVGHAGWGIDYLAEAGAYHLGGGTSRQVKAHRLFYATRSRIIYAFKHFAGLRPWLVAAGTLAVEPAARVARALARGSAREAADSLRACGWLWRDLPGIAARSRSARHDPEGAVNTSAAALACGTLPSGLKVGG